MALNSPPPTDPPTLLTHTHIPALPLFYIEKSSSSLTASKTTRIEWKSPNCSTLGGGAGRGGKGSRGWGGGEGPYGDTGHEGKCGTVIVMPARKCAATAAGVPGVMAMPSTTL